MISGTPQECCRLEKPRSLQENTTYADCATVFWFPGKHVCLQKTFNCEAFLAGLDTTPASHQVHAVPSPSIFLIHPDHIRMFWCSKRFSFRNIFTCWGSDPTNITKDKRNKNKNKRKKNKNKNRKNQNNNKNKNSNNNKQEQGKDNSDNNSTRTATATTRKPWKRQQRPA